MALLDYIKELKFDRFVFHFFYSQQASQQIDNLQQQLQFVANQRDQAYLQYSALQEQNQMYSTSMANLQMVLEQFQQGEFLQVLSHQENVREKCTPMNPNFIW